MTLYGYYYGEIRIWFGEMLKHNFNQYTIAYGGHNVAFLPVISSTVSADKLFRNPGKFKLHKD